MKILIEVPYDTKLLVAASPNCGALLQSLTEATLVKSTGYGKEQKWELVEPDKVLTFEMKPDNFMDAINPHDPIAVLRSEKELAEKRWIEYYSKSQSAQKELDEIKSDLDSRGISYKKSS